MIGYDANEKPVAVAEFNYEFIGASQQMVFANVGPDFKNRKHVDFATDSIVAGILISRVIDDVDFSVTKYIEASPTDGFRLTWMGGPSYICIRRNCGS